MIPDCSKEDILAALNKFDNELRNLSGWEDWETKKSQHWAISHDDKRYPPKEIIRLATNHEAFSGGNEANSYLEKRGFKIIDLRKGIDTEDDSRPKYWALEAGYNAKQWDDFKDNNLIAIDFGVTRDLRELKNREEIKKELQDIFSKNQAEAGRENDDSEYNPIMNSLAVYEFLAKMKPGDFVIVKQGRRKLLGYGKILSDYKYIPEREAYKHVRDVEWIKTGEWEIPEDRQITTKTLTDFTKYPKWLNDFLPLFEEEITTSEMDIREFLWQLGPDKILEKGIATRGFELNNHMVGGLLKAMQEMNIDRLTYLKDWYINADGYFVNKRAGINDPMHYKDAVKDGAYRKINNYANPFLYQTDLLEKAKTDKSIKNTWGFFKEIGEEELRNRKIFIEKKWNHLKKQSAEPLLELMIEKGISKLYYSNKWYLDADGTCLNMYWNIKEPTNIRDLSKEQSLFGYTNQCINPLYKWKPGEEPDDSNDFSQEMDVRQFLENIGLEQLLSKDVFIIFGSPKYRLGAKSYEPLIQFMDDEGVKKIYYEDQWYLDDQGYLINKIRKDGKIENPVHYSKLENANDGFIDCNPVFNPYYRDLSKEQQQDNVVVSFEKILVNLKDKGLYFHKELVSNYLLSLQTKRFVMLTGISGTGKTKLAMEIARMLASRITKFKPISIPDDAEKIVAQNYMVTRGLVVVPAKMVDFITLPDVDEKKGKHPRIDVLYPGGKDNVVTVRKPNHERLLILSFKGEMKKWFTTTLTKGDEFYLRILEPESDDEPNKLEILIPETKTELEILHNSAVIAVRPDWTDNRGLLGYFNPITQTYVSTPALELIMEAEKHPVHPFFLILDEMNLARVEHYFSDFLSCMESGEALHLHDSDTIEGGETEEGISIPKEIRIPDNLFIIGTVNVDETTYMFSPKVLDRAFTIELCEVDLRNFGTSSAHEDKTEFALDNFDGQLKYDKKPDTMDWDEFCTLEYGGLKDVIIQLNDILQQDNRHFGYRVANEISRYVLLAKKQGDRTSESIWTALDLAILQKVLPKFHGTQQELEAILGKMFYFACTMHADYDKARHKPVFDAFSVLNSCLLSKSTEGVYSEQPKLPRTAAKLYRMLRRLKSQGFTSFID